MTTEQQQTTPADDFKSGARRGRMSDVNIIMVGPENPSAKFQIVDNAIVQHETKSGDVHDCFKVVEFETKEEGLLLIGEGGGLRKRLEKELEITGTLVDKVYLAEFTGKLPVEKVWEDTGKKETRQVNQYELYIRPLSDYQA